MLRSIINKLRGSARRKPATEVNRCAVIFAEARAATSQDSPRQVAIINASCALCFLPAPLPEEISEEQIEQVRGLLAPEPRRTIVAIADTRVSGSLSEINKTIPFIGLLTGLAYLGHHVIVFDGEIDRIDEGCRDAEVLIIDGAILPQLHRDWYVKARSAMRKPEMYVHDRNTFALRPILPNPRVTQ